MNNKVMLTMLENEDTRYEIYMFGIRRSNVDDTIIRWEVRYNVVQKLSLGSTVSYGNRIVGKTLEDMIAMLLLKGFEPVTRETQKFA